MPMKQAGRGTMCSTPMPHSMAQVHSSISKAWESEWVLILEFYILERWYVDISYITLISPAGSRIIPGNQILCCRNVCLFTVSEIN